MITTATLNSSSAFMPGADVDEQQLVHLAQQGDQDAFACLYDSYIERIYRYVYFRVGEDEIAEDITSQVFLKSWEKLALFQIGPTPFIAWLYRIAHNTIIDYYRTRKTSISLDDAAQVDINHVDGTDERLDQQFESKQLHEALKQLTNEQQQVLTLKFIDGFSTRQIAKKLGKQQGAIRALQMRALQTLAKCPQFQQESVV
jgi:RNA polymerase sigma-70 factor, ECF subfamily